MILGEWGEGKTDAYKRYIQPKSQAEGNYAFFVSASTLSNGYEIPLVTRLLETTALSALRFLVVLFNCVREESRRADIPQLERYEDAHTYLNAVLKNLVGDQKIRRVFIFIDEFEELLLNLPRLKDIISGIKETINGRFTAIDEGGEYEGCVHLIVAATPDAFYRLQVDEETALIFGGLGRRGGVIELPQIRKHEGMEFLIALLKYSYKNNLPETLPFDNLGIFHSLFRITQGNPGNIVSLFTRLMSSAKLDKQRIKNIDSQHLLKFLEKEQVFVYGGTTPCLETETFFRILKIVEEQRVKEIGEKCALLLKIIVGEFKPFSIQEVEGRIGHGDVKNLISIINNDIRTREGIERAILKVSPLREGKSFRDVQEAFKEHIVMERDKKYIKIDNYSELLEDLEDRITFFAFNGDKINSQIYLPSERHSLMSFLEGITSERAVEIEHLVNRRLCKDEDCYLASDDLLSQVFPTPIPRELEFIKNRELRMTLWRDVTRNLAEQYETYMPTAFMNLLERSKLFKLTETGRRVLRSPARFADLVIDEIKINSMFYSINGDVKNSDIEELNRLITGTRPPVHCTVLLYTGEITQDAEDKIINKELGKEGQNIILEAHVHPTLAKRIISIYRASFQQEEINESLLMSVVRRIVMQELDFQSKVKDWLDIQEKKGIVIRDLPMEATSSLREFADALKFYINFMEQESTVQEIFNKNREMLKFVKYEAKKISLIPDIELPKFTRLTEDLTSNGFLLQSKGKYALQLHPVEERILRILEKETKLSDAELEGFFIIKSMRFLKDGFLPILEYKGLIRREGANYLLSDRNQLSTDVEDEFQRFKRLTETKKYRDYGYIYMTKAKGDCRFFALKDFEVFVTGLNQQAEEIVGLDERRALQKLSLLMRFLQHFIEEFLPFFDGAANKADEVLIAVRSLHSNIKDDFEQVKTECSKWLKLEFSVENMSEYKEVKKTYENIENSVRYNDEDIARAISEIFGENELKVFYFRNDNETAFYFNPKLYLMSLLKDKLDDAVSKINRLIEAINNQFRSLNQQQAQIEHEIRTKTVEDKAKFSYMILGLLKQLVKDMLPQIQPMAFESITLMDINRYMEQNIQSINLNLNNMSNCITFLEEVKTDEQLFLSALGEGIKLSEYALFVFDIKDYDTVAKNFDSLLQNIASEYDKNLKSIVLQDAYALLQKMKSLRSILESLTRRIGNEKPSIDAAWSKYARESNEFVTNMEYILGLLRKSYDIDIKQVIAGLSSIRQNIGVRQVTNVKLRLSEIEQMKNETRQKFYEVIKPILEEKELQLLELVVKKTRPEGREWLSTRELQQFAKNELNIQPNVVSEILQKLIERGLFREGVSLSF